MCEVTTKSPNKLLTKGYLWSMLKPLTSCKPFLGSLSKKNGYLSCISSSQHTPPIYLGFNLMDTKCNNPNIKAIFFVVKLSLTKNATANHFNVRDPARHGERGGLCGPRRPERRLPAMAVSNGGGGGDSFETCGIKKWDSSPKGMGIFLLKTGNLPPNKGYYNITNPKNA